MKKVMFLILVVLVVLTMFLGCGSKPSQDNAISESDRPSQDSEEKEDVDSNDVSRAFTDQGVYEYIDHVLKTYNREYVFIDLEEARFYFAYHNLTNERLEVRYKDLSDYSSDAELEKFSETIDYYISIFDWATDYDDFHYVVQNVDDMQKGSDELWGKDRIDIKEILDDLLSESESIYLSKKGFLISANNFNTTYDGFRENTYFDITEINMEGDTATVYVNYLVLSRYGYNPERRLILDFSDERTIGRYIEESDWPRGYGNASFDELVSRQGIDRKTLGEFEFLIKNTSSGPVLDGYKIVDHKNYSSDLVIPDSLLNAVPFSMVMPEAGLNLRTGPGTEYDVITLIPRGVWVNERGDDGDEEGWLFVSCTLNGTEHFGWVNSEYLAYFDN